MAQRIRLLTAALALAFLVVHAQSLPHSLEDIDTINLALGVESFDVVQHRPHPPGYPVFIALGKMSTPVVGALAPSWSRTERAAVGLAVWGVAAGTLAAFVLVRFWTVLGWAPLAAWFGAALSIVSPLFWFTSARPLTDVSALVAAMVVQGAVLRELRAETKRPAVALVQACAAGLLIGLRTQTMWLTAPLLIWLVAQALSRGAWRHAAGLAGAAMVGTLVWAVPLVWLTGGLDAYLGALMFQGADDFAAVSMLATAPDVNLLIARLSATFIAPWRVAWLGDLVVILALIGSVDLLRRSRRAFALLACAFSPYLVFHLLFQDVDTVRYALPFVVPVAGLAVRAMWLLPRRGAVVLALLVTAVSAVTAHGVLRLYTTDVPPTFLAFQEAEARALSSGEQPLVVTHDGVRRVADWFRPEWPTLPVQRPDERTWLRIIEHFRGGATTPAWFLADRRRAHAVMFEHRSRRVEKEYLRDPAVRYFIGQTRQDEVRWYHIVQPGWMLERGWALSPDTGAVAFADREEPHQVPARAYVLRRPSAHRLMIGGRLLAATADGVLVVEIDGQVTGRWPIQQSQPWFLHFADLPAHRLDGAGPYATLTARVEGLGDGAPPRIEIAQFDIAPADQIMAGLSEGWYEAEANPDSGQAWRWSSDSSNIIVFGGQNGARLVLAGESTQRYFERPSTVTIKVNGMALRSFAAADDFSETIVLPGDQLRASPSIVTIEADQVFVPAERGESADQRRLGLRLRRADISPLP